MPVKYCKISDLPKVLTFEIKMKTLNILMIYSGMSYWIEGVIF